MLSQPIQSHSHSFAILYIKSNCRVRRINPCDAREATSPEKPSELEEAPCSIREQGFWKEDKSFDIPLEREYEVVAKLGAYRCFR